MSNIVIIGRVLKISNIRKFNRKDGSPGKVGSFIIGDKSGTIKVVLWNEQVEITRKEYFRIGEIIQVIGGYSKIGLNDEIEVHLSKTGKIILSPRDVSILQFPELDSFRDLKGTQSFRKDSELSIKDLYEKEGFIKTITGLVKVEEFKELVKKDGETTFLLKLILSDDTSSIRVLVWNMNAVKTLKILSDGDNVQLSNVAIKENPYTNEKELIFTKKSSLDIR
jgi:replication factor A1